MVPVKNALGEPRSRAATFFGERDSLKCAAPDIERAALVAEPGSTSARARRAAVSVAAKRSRASASEKDHSFTPRRRQLPGLFRDRRSRGRIAFGYAFSKKVVTRWATPVRSAPPKPAQMPRIFPAWIFLKAQDRVPCVAQREPCACIARAQRGLTARGPASQDVAFRVGKNAVRLCATAVKSEEV